MSQLQNGTNTDDSKGGDDHLKSQKEEDEKKEPTNASEAFDSLLESVGNGDSWQLRTAILLGVMGCFTSFHNLGAVFLGATPDYKCDNPYLPKDPTINPQLYEQLLNFTTPWTISNEGKIVRSKCFYYDRTAEFLSDNPELHLLPDFNGTSSAGGSGDKDAYDLISSSFSFLSVPPSDQWIEEPEQIACSKWIYNQTLFRSTVVTEWDLVCDRIGLKPTIQGSYMVGIWTGAVAASGISDRFGRRPALLGSCFLFTTCSLIAVFSTSLEMFLIFRFILGAAGQGTTLIKFVLMTEINGRYHRDFYGILNSSGWLIGAFCLATLSYFFNEWRHLQLALTIPMFILISMYWIIPESPRWLLMKGRSEEGLEILKNIGKVNGGKQLPPKEELDLCLAVINKELLAKRKIAVSWTSSWKEFFHNVYLLVKTPNMRRRSLVMFYTWFVVSMVSYGAAFSGENIGVSVHVLTGIGAIAGIPSNILQYYSTIKLGRRTTLCYAYILSGCFLVAIIFVPTSMGYVNLTLTILAGMFFGLVWGSVFFYSTELVPTSIRNTSIGIASSFARVGSTIGPFIVDLGGSVYYALPSTVFGGLSLIGGLLALLLPDTAQKRLAETIEEIELMPK